MSNHQNRLEYNSIHKANPLTFLLNVSVQGFGHAHMQTVTFPKHKSNFGCHQWLTDIKLESAEGGVHHLTAGSWLLHCCCRFHTHGITYYGVSNIMYMLYRMQMWNVAPYSNKEHTSMHVLKQWCKPTKYSIVQNKGTDFWSTCFMPHWLCGGLLLYATQMPMYLTPHAARHHLQCEC